MEEPDAVVVQTATTPAQAKVFVALLQAEGIPAYVEGDTLTDAVAASRRLMNLQGVRVLVPRSAQARAQEILADARVDDAEIESQALAAGPAPDRGAHAAAPGDAPAQRGPVLWALGASAMAIVFFSLWMGRGDTQAAMRDYVDRKWAHALPDGSEYAMQDVDTERMADGVRWRLRDGGRILREAFDRDRDGRYEEVHYFDRDGRLQTVMHFDAKGHATSIEEHRDGLRQVLQRDERGETSEFTLFDQDGKAIRRQRWDGANGYVDAPLGR